ncbi:MAG: hypothetical protein HFI08_05135 [Bacilli bacterium]|nr:hypothetical protein [Bacilli bacterium]
MSFKNARILIERNKIDTPSESSIPSVSVLLQQYKRQVERYQELLQELALWNKRLKNKQNQKRTEHTSIEEERKPQITSSKTSTFSIPYSDIITFLQNATDLNKTKQQIITHLYQEACTFNEMAKNYSNFQDKEACKREIEAILCQIGWIQNFQKSEKKEVNSATHNNIMFLTSSSGRIIPLEEIMKNIPMEFYDSLKEALLSIENRTFIGFKPLTKRKYNELKKADIRVLYSRVNENTFLILSCFIKDFYSNLKYRENLKRLNDILEKNESEYKTLAQDPNYLEEQDKIKNTIYNILTKKRDEENGQPLERSKKI